MILNSKDKGRRGRYFRGRAGVFQIGGVPPPFYLFLVLRVGTLSTVGVSVNITNELAASNDMKRS